MSGETFHVQNFIGSRFKLSAAWTISLADLLYRNRGLLFKVKIHCQISAPFFQDSSFQLRFKKKRSLNFFFFFVPQCTLLNVQKIISYFQY